MREALFRGARGGHRASMVAPMQPALQLEGDFQPYVVADAALQEREDAWSHPGAAWLPKPAEFHRWDLLPPISLQAMRQAAWSYSATTARGAHASGAEVFLLIVGRRDHGDRESPGQMSDSKRSWCSCPSPTGASASSPCFAPSHVRGTQREDANAAS